MSNGMRNEFASHTDFGFLRGLFDEKPNILPSNVDMIYGINGQFLLAEWKRDSEEILLGQRILLKSFAQQPNFTVLIVNGYSDSTGTHVDSFYQVASDKLIFKALIITVIVDLILLLNAADSQIGSLVI